MLKIAARDIKRRVAAGHDRLAGSQGDVTTDRCELRGIAFDQAKQSSHIPEWRSYPVFAVINSGVSDIHRQGHATHVRVPLERRIRQFAAAQFDS